MRFKRMYREYRSSFLGYFILKLMNRGRNLRIFYNNAMKPSDKTKLDRDKIDYEESMENYPVKKLFRGDNCWWTEECESSF